MTLKAFDSAAEAVAHPEPRIHDYGDSGNLHKLIDLGVRRRGSSDCRSRSGAGDLFFLKGTRTCRWSSIAAVADVAPDGKLTLTPRTAAA